MLRYLEVLGLPVSSVAAGTKMGTLAGVVIDPDLQRICWLSLNSGGRYEGRHWISVADIHSIDKEGVKVRGEVSVRAPQDADEAERLVLAGSRIVGKRAVTEEGLNLGRVEDYEFDSETWILKRLIVSKAESNTHDRVTVDANRIEAVREDHVVVAEGASVHPGGGLHASGQSERPGPWWRLRRGHLLGSK